MKTFRKGFVGDKETVVHTGGTNCSPALSERRKDVDGGHKRNDYRRFGVNKLHDLGLTLFIVTTAQHTVQSTFTILRPRNLLI